jgi:transglutaminase-like putative cysteine protease
MHPGLRYHVVSVPRVVADPTDLAVAHNATGPDAAAHRRVPAQTPPVVREAARTATAAAVTPFQQAYLLTAYLRENFVYDPQAVSGHTLGHLQFFLETGRRGTSEQFAATFAVAARTIGLATRVVVGFAPPGASGQVRAGDAFAWPEVAFEGLGWVPFYPTPGPSSSDPSNVPGESSTAAAMMLEAASAPQPTPETPRREPARRLPAAIETEKPSWLPVAALAAAGVLAVAAIAYLGIAVTRPAVRRRRRRKAVDDRDRLVGAWHDTLDTLDGYGVVVRAAATPNETAGAARVVRTTVNGTLDDPLRRLAALASVALFAPEPVRRPAADEAWEQQTRLRRALRREVPRRRRLRGRLAPRRVLGRRPRPRPAPQSRT